MQGEVAFITQGQAITERGTQPRVRTPRLNMVRLQRLIRRSAVPTGVIVTAQHATTPGARGVPSLLAIRHTNNCGFIASHRAELHVAALRSDRVPLATDSTQTLQPQHCGSLLPARDRTEPANITRVCLKRMSAVFAALLDAKRRHLDLRRGDRLRGLLRREQAWSRAVTWIAAKVTRLDCKRSAAVSTSLLYSFVDRLLIASARAKSPFPSVSTRPRDSERRTTRLALASNQRRILGRQRIRLPQLAIALAAHTTRRARLPLSTHSTDDQWIGVHRSLLSLVISVYRETVENGLRWCNHQEGRVKYPHPLHSP